LTTIVGRFDTGKMNAAPSRRSSPPAAAPAQPPPSPHRRRAAPPPVVGNLALKAPAPSTDHDADWSEF
jgi:hypothetical protein